MIKEQEGPVNGMMPATMYKTCQGCKHYSYRLVKSGNNPIYRQDCKLDIAPRAGMLSMSGNLEQNEFNMPIPGEWCPFDAVNVIDLV